MIRKGTVGEMTTTGTSDGVGRNQVLIVNTGATTALVVVIDRTAGTAVVDLITFATHS